MSIWIDCRQITDSSCEEWISGSEYEWVTDDEADDVATLPKKYLRFFWFRSLVESLQASPAQRRRLLRTCDRVGMDANTTAIVLLKFDDEVNITRKAITDLLFAELELMGLHDQIPVDEKRLEVLKDNCLQIDKKTRSVCPCRIEGVHHRALRFFHVYCFYAEQSQ